MAERVRAVVGGDPPAPSEPSDGIDDRDGGLPMGLWARLADRVPVRLDPGRRAVVAIGAVVVLVAVATGLWVLGSRPREMPVSDAAPTVAGSALVPSASAAGRPGGRSQSLAVPSGVSGAGAAGAPGGVSPAGVVVVDVAGKVRRPGLYRLPTGSRVDDAVRAAGGALRGVDLGSLNLAAPLIDGQQIAVGRPGAVAGGPAAPESSGAGTAGGGAAGGATGTGPVNLNTATLEQLEALPGIGPALGQRILDYRTEHGTFTSVDQLDDVSGIGTVTFERLRPLVTV